MQSRSFRYTSVVVTVLLVAALVLVIFFVVGRSPQGGNERNATETPANLLNALDASQSSTPIPASADSQSDNPRNVLGDVQRISGGGFAFQPLSGYKIDLSSESVNMQAENADPAIGPVFLLSGGPLLRFVSNKDADLDSTFAQFIDRFESEGNFEVGARQGYQGTQISGLLADITDPGDDEASFAGRIFMAHPKADQIFVLVGIAPFERWQTGVEAEFRALLDSITLLDLADPSIAFREFDAAYRAILPTATPLATPTLTPTPQIIGTPIWRVYTNGDMVNDVASDGRVEGETLWAATGGGVVARNLANNRITKYTTLDGLPANNIRSVVFCPLAELGIVFATENGLAIFNTERRAWRTLNSRNSAMSFDDVALVECDQTSTTLVIGYTRSGVDLLNADNNSWQYIDRGLDSSIGSEADVGINAINDLLFVAEQKQVWLAQNNGLLVAAESNRQLLDASNSPLIGNALFSIASAPDGTVWLGGDGALYKISPIDDGEQTFAEDSWSIYSAETIVGSNFPAGPLTGLAVANDGIIWVASRQGEICAFDTIDELCTQFYDAQAVGLADTTTASLSELHISTEGTLFFAATGEGIGHFAGNSDGGQWQMLRLEGQILRGNSIYDLVQDSRGFIWVASNDGVQQLRADSGSMAVSSDARMAEQNTTNVRVMQPDPTGGIWLGGVDADFVDEEGVTSYTLLNGLVGSPISSIALDTQDRTWLGTTAGLSIINGESVFNLTGNEGLPDDEILSLLVDTESGSVWIGTAAGGLLRFERNQLQLFHRNNARLPSNRITALAKDTDGTLLVGTDRGLARFSGTRASQIRPIGSAEVTTIASAADGQIWVGTRDDGVYYFNGLAWQQFSTRDNLPSQHIGAILIDSAGAIWIGGADGGLTQFIAESP